MLNLTLGLVSLMLATSVLAAGSWVGQVGPVRALMPERGMASTPMAPPPAVSAGVIEEVRWRYRVPAGQSVIGWLCYPGGCASLDSAAGINRALAGLPATTPLHFRFALAPGQRAAVQVSDLQVIVNYR
ncbi:flagellar protein FlhE [Halomonas sp.]|uniref:flagellar protein FlhE n=1 Tax=Halomonas sp. TaxID=1486246 RepID=UPI00384B21E6